MITKFARLEFELYSNPISGSMEVKNPGPNQALVYPQRGFALLKVHSLIEIPNIKYQISNKFQHAAPALRVTKIRKSKQCLVLEGFGH
jgi:hypothetical protein